MPPLVWRGFCACRKNAPQDERSVTPTAGLRIFPFGEAKLGRFSGSFFKNLGCFHEKH
jgi:hypothetical protein